MNTNRMHTQFSDDMITIRPYAMADAPLLFEAARECLPDAVEWMPWCHADYSIAESESWVSASIEKWAAGREYNFVITDASTGRYLGGAGLNRLDAEYNMANLGYWVRKSERGKGIAAAATRLVAHFGIAELGLQRLEVVVAVPNTASCRAAEKSGAVREGILRKRLITAGIICDAVMHSIVADDLTK